MPIEERIIRYDDFVPCTTAFIDARTPGSDKKENFCLIGSGVAENPGQHTHIKIPHGFDIGGARQPHGCKNSHHSHDTEEVFMVFSGDWKFTWGQKGEDGEAILSAGDVISLPTNMFRGFENVGEDNAFLFAVLGVNNDGTAGSVIWAPYVFHQAKSHGLILLEDGQLVDTVVGEKVPEGANEYTPISVDTALNDFDRYSVDDMQQCIARKNEHDQLAAGGLSYLPGISEHAVIGNGNPAEDFEPGKMAWQHSFQLRHLTIEPGASIPLHSRAEEEVVIVQRGQLAVDIDGDQAELGAGDVLTTPVGAARCYSNTSDETVAAYVVRRGSHPSAATML